MTGGGGALPYFNAFMSEFMKDKPKDNFEKPPEIPAELKSHIEQRKREEIEKLEKAEIEGEKGVPIPTKQIRRSSENSKAPEDGEELTEPADGEEPPPLPQPNASPKTGGENQPKPPVIKPTPATTKKPVVPPEEPENKGTKRKGKKGDSGT